MVVLALTLPAMIAVRLGARRLGPVLEVLCTLPLVVPPFVFVAGISTVLTWGPKYLETTPFFKTFTALQLDLPIILVIALMWSWHCPMSTGRSTPGSARSTCARSSRPHATSVLAGRRSSCR